ncbi:tetratricopeptide repeat protein [Rhodoferax sp. GW822-FHT02A01]|uniref:tetratricopeptide repeat protein n=1 Tax=Rhodoferax sp. GW822-FHT02A01 TaxID=3141537 RepID=UPI00315C4FFA
MTLFKRSKLAPLMLLMALGLHPAWAQFKTPQNSELNGDLMYELLVSEISAQSGDNGSAFQLMLDAAQKTRSEQLFERAVEIALRARAGDSALQAAQAWAKAQPTSRNALRFVLQILIGLNRLPETIEPVRRDLALLQGMERASAIGQLPRFFVRVNDKKQAAKVVEQALSNEIGNATTGPAAYATIGTMRLLAGDGEGALEAARKGAALNPKAEEPVQLALALMDPKLPAAEAMVLRHLQAASRPELRMGYVRKLLEAQRLQDAKAQVIAINDSTPDFADAWLVRGSLALQERNESEGRFALNTFVKLRAPAGDAPADAVQDRGLTQAYFMLADLAEQSQQWDEAEHYLDLIDSPQDALRVQGRRAANLARQGKLDKARALIRSAPELQPEDARTKVNMEVQLLRDSRQYQAAYELLKQAAQNNPDDVDYAYDLAMAAEKLDKVDEMETLLRQLIAARPDYYQAYNALGYSLADRKLRLDEARELIRKALEAAPNDPFIQDSMGWVEFRSGNLAQARQILQDAYRNRPDPEIAAHLGEVLWSLSLKPEAQAIWKEGLAQSPDNETLRETIKRLSAP